MTPSIRTVATVALAFSVVLSTGAGVAAAAGTTTLTVSFADGNDTVAPGETTTAVVAVAAADGGVGAAELNVTVDDPSVAQVTNATVLGSGATDLEIDDDGAYADVEYAFRDTTESGQVPIVRVTLEGVATGETSVRLVPSAGNDEVFVYDEEGTGYNITDIDGATATVTVTRNESQSGPPAIVDGPGRPTDPDGDGLYEDVDGDGQMSIIDVVKFLDVFDTPAVESNQAAFDFDGNGRATILDVVALLNRL